MTVARVLHGVSDSNQPWHLYLLRCNDGSLYTGIAKDLSRRIVEHQSGSSKSAKYLRGRGPLTLEFSCSLENRSNALKAEIRVKRLSKQQKEALILGHLELSDLLRTPTD